MRVCFRDCGCLFLNSVVMRGGLFGLVFSVVSAFVLWGVMFGSWFSGVVDFWWAMFFSTVFLCVSGFCLGGVDLSCFRLGVRDVVWGVVIAVCLWFVFWLGDKVAGCLFGFARGQVDSIYLLKEGRSPWLLSLMLLLFIGPAEELYWRGYVQRVLSVRFGGDVGFVVCSLLYGFVHVWSCNFMLVAAALTAGVVWGGLYRLFPGRLMSIVVSHALWDVAVFVWFPI